MTIDPGLEVAVDAFVEAVSRALVQATASLPDQDPGALRASTVTEAFNLACGFIDADGVASDDELWALIGAFGRRMGPDFARSTPDDLRADGVTRDASRWLGSTSDLFEILLGVDRRNGTDLATTYSEHALAVAHMVASLDTHTGRTELLAIDAFRGLLLSKIKGTPGGGQLTTGASGSGAPRQGNETGRAGAVPADATTGPAAEADAPPVPLGDLLSELDELVGLDEVKREVKLVTDLLQVQRLRRERGLPVAEASRHLIFTGNPGTGKTTVARLLAQIYRTLGVVTRGHLVETDRAGLVAGYVGQTATRVTEAFDRADGGVLLIDEAYALVRGSDTDFGREAIDTIVKLVEDRRDRLVVIAAGYPDEMADFVDANPGLPSRFPRTISFPDYDDDELTAIFATLCTDNGYGCGAPSLAAVRAWFGGQPRGKGFGNGRLARNLFEQAIGRQAGRVVALAEPTDAELTELRPGDISGGDTSGDTSGTDPAGQR